MLDEVFVGVAFAQYFWSATKRYDDWRRLDAPLAAAKGNPFTFSAFPTWWRSPGLAFSALMMMSMIFIPIFVPGSIRVVTASGIMQPCNVNFPNISLAWQRPTQMELQRLRRQASLPYSSAKHCLQLGGTMGRTKPYI